MPELIAQEPAAVRGVGDRRRAERRRVGAGPPRVALVAAQVVPRREVGVVVLAAGLEQVRVVGDEHRRHVRAPQRRGDRLLPQLDRPPRLPEEVERADEDVVAGRHARQRPGDVVRELRRTSGEPVEVRRGELGAAVRPEHVPVERVEQDDDDVPRGLHRADRSRARPSRRRRTVARRSARSSRNRN